MKYKQRIVLVVILLAVFFVLSLRFLFNTQPDPKDDDLLSKKVSHHFVENRRNLHVDGPLDHVTSGPTLPPTTPPTDHSKPWKIWSDWVREDVLYPDGVLQSKEMDLILNALSTYPVTQLDVGYKGTQLKATMHLEGGQRAVFKPMRLVKFKLQKIFELQNLNYKNFESQKI